MSINSVARPLIAITIYEHGKTEAAVSKLTLAEAKRRWCRNVPRAFEGKQSPTVAAVVQEFEVNPTQVRPLIPTKTLPSLMDNMCKEIETIMAMSVVDADECRRFIPQLDKLAALIAGVRKHLMIPTPDGSVTSSQTTGGVSDGNTTHEVIGFA